MSFPRSAEGGIIHDMQLTNRVHVVGRGPWGGLTPLSTDGACSNVYLLDGGSELALIDTGMPDGLDRMLDNIRAAGFDLSRLTKVLLTHGHWDHIAATGELLQRLGRDGAGPPIRVFGHPITRETMAEGPGIYLPEYRAPHYPAPVHHTITEGDTITVGDLTLRVWHIPGHTPDALAFLFDTPAGVHAFTGDTAIGDQPDGRGGTAPGVIGWIEWVWRSNLTDYRHSVQRLRDAGFAAIFPGHGNAHLSPQAVRQSLDHCVQRLDQFLAIPALRSMIPETV
jgi:hydroxyacylglutathione hydrolase